MMTNVMVVVVMITHTTISTLAQVSGGELPNDPDTSTCILYLPRLLDNGMGAAGGTYCLPQFRC